MKSAISGKRADALFILKDGEMELGQFATRMWKHAVTLGFARKFLGGMVKLGYLERKENGKAEVYKVTGEGEGVAIQTRCGYCKISREKTKLVENMCGTCGSFHWACTKCLRKEIKVVGEFPRYRPALKECPK
jgi:predicted transcriptional regulator